MMQPDVSIIVPIHNSEKYIEECINSAVRQSYKNIEIICVGGSGEDNSETIVKKYQK